jgi:hypothetical protein
VPPDANGEVDGEECELGTVKFEQVPAACTAPGNNRHKESKNTHAYGEQIHAE